MVDFVRCTSTLACNLFWIYMKGVSGFNNLIQLSHRNRWVAGLWSPSRGLEWVWDGPRMITRACVYLCGKSEMCSVSLFKTLGYGWKIRLKWGIWIYWNKWKYRSCSHNISRPGIERRVDLLQSEVEWWIYCPPACCQTRGSRCPGTQNDRTLGWTGCTSGVINQCLF